MKAPTNLLASVFANPASIIGHRLADWDLLIRQASQAGVLARLGWLLEREALIGNVPQRPLAHIRSAQAVVRQFGFALDWEIQCIQNALRELGAPCVFLKGAAYVLAGNLAASGRMFSDVDILVPKDSLFKAEALLRKHGWVRNKISAYDTRYYIDWMHELPPMQHIGRNTSIDVHHNILPITTRNCPDAALLFNNIVKSENGMYWILSAEDRLLHSAAHLFHEGELDHGFRDLSDMDLLIREFALQDGFWERLTRRADALNLLRCLYYCLRYTKNIFNTPVPEEVLARFESDNGKNPKQAILDFMFHRALMANHRSCDDRWTGLSRFILYIRSHWIRMPLHQLIPHLLRKAWVRLAGGEH